jgi:Ion channel
MTRTEELTDFVCSAAVLFLCAEEGRNPSVRTFWDALHYVSTSLSVGYANIFPVTQAGRAIGAVVQMVGPALSAKALERDAPDRMDELLTELRKITALLPAPA